MGRKGSGRRKKSGLGSHVLVSKSPVCSGVVYVREGMQEHAAGIAPRQNDHGGHYQEAQQTPLHQPADHGEDPLLPSGISQIVSGRRPPSTFLTILTPIARRVKGQSRPATWSGEPGGRRSHVVAVAAAYGTIQGPAGAAFVGTKGLCWHRQPSHRRRRSHSRQHSMSSVCASRMRSR